MNHRQASDGLLVAIATCLLAVSTGAHVTSGESSDVSAPGDGAFVDHGIGARVAESRGVVTTCTSDGRCLAVANALDTGPSGYVLVTDIDSEVTRQVFCPPDVPQGAAFASLLASSGRFYSAQGGVLFEFDPATLAWTWHGKPSAVGSNYLSFTEGLDGTIWAGAVYQTTLVSYDPRTGLAHDHGRLDPVEMYLMHLAVDDAGWVYGGIGTARGQIVAYDPSTGERRPIVAEEARVQETAVVHPLADGSVYGLAAGQSYRLHAGEATPIAAADAGPRRVVGNIYFGQTTGTFPDGRRLRAYDLPGRWLEVEDPRDGSRRRIAIEYEPAGVEITSLGEGPRGVVYGSTAHPMRFLAVDTRGGALVDHGGVPAIGGGNLCAISHQGEKVVGAEYPHGRLWTYDPDLPWDPSSTNPRWVAEWPRDIARPRTVLAHPDGRHVVVGGYADYGLVGGGLGIHDLATGESSLLSADADLLPGHSPIALAALPGGDLVAGTSVDAPGGGHTTATEGELFIVDWATRSLAFRTVPVPGARSIVSVLVAPDGRVHGVASDATWFVFDPATRTVVHRHRFDGAGGVPRHALQLGRHGEVYLMLGRAIARIDAHSLEVTPLDAPPAPITAGGAYSGGRLWYASTAHVWSYVVPPVGAVFLPVVESRLSTLTARLGGSM